MATQKGIAPTYKDIFAAQDSTLLQITPSPRTSHQPAPYVEATTPPATVDVLHTKMYTLEGDYFLTPFKN